MLPQLPCGSVLKLGTSNGVLGGVVWPAAATLCRYLLKNQCDLRLVNHNNSKNTKSNNSNNKKIACVELGSGTGAVGLFAAALGGTNRVNVILTDFRPLPEAAMYSTDGTVDLPKCGSDSIMDLLQENVNANEGLLRIRDDDGPPFETSSQHLPQVMDLDWTNPSQTQSVLDAGPKQEHGPTSISSQKNSGFDLVLGSDITHFSSMHQPLASNIAKLLAHRPSAICLLSHEERLINLQGQDSIMQNFESIARAEGLSMQHVPFENSNNNDAQQRHIPNQKSIFLLRHCKFQEQEKYRQLIL